MLNKELVRELFKYDAQSGNIIRKVTVSHNAKENSVAGSLYQDGFLHTTVKGKTYPNNRIVWLLHHEKLPRFIEHIDGDPLNQKIENLREFTPPFNKGNSNRIKSNTSGFRGVVWDNNLSAWRVQISSKGRTHCAGYFTDPIDAAQMYNMWALYYHKEKAIYNQLPDNEAYGVF